MLQVEAVVSAVPRPSLVNVKPLHSRKMEDRKRSASEYDDSAALPPAKRQATLMVNGEDQQLESNNIRFGPAGSPWLVDLAVCDSLTLMAMPDGLFVVEPGC
jgi:hypothetical protein